MDAPQGRSDRDKSNPSSSPVSVVSNFWKEFDLEKEKSVLDEQGLRVAENQENSQKNRRKLAESTGDFKKASAEEKLSLFNSLLKGYQEEVNNLTKRAKFGENAFLNIYQKLYEAPDPYPALASIAEQDLKISELESENRKMKVELDEFRTEAMHLKNQQATIRRLEERNRQLEQQKKMSRQASSAANDSQPTRRTLRKWAYDDDVILVSCMVDLHNIGNYNADTGFKTGFLLELERMMARKLPNSNIKGKPHIESRIKTLKKDWSTIFDMVQGCGNSGFGWDSMKNMVTAEEPVWESYLISHKDAAQFRVRSFAFYKQLCQIYAKERALRRDAQTAANILEEIVEEDNVQTATNIHDAEDGNQSHLGLEDMDISSTQCLASTSASTKKRKAHGMGESIFEESFIKAATLLGNKMEIVGRELSKSIGSEMIIQQRVQELYGVLCEIDDLTEDELDNVLSKIPNQPNQLLVFFSLPST